jgi:AraC-like DNA-binding protein
LTFDWSRLRHKSGHGRQVATIAQLRRARRYIDACFDQPSDLEQIAREAQLSPWHFLRLFRAAYDRTPHEYLQARRLFAPRSCWWPAITP